MDFLKDWASIILSLIAIATTIWNLFTSSAKSAHSRINRMEEDRSKTADVVVERFQHAESRILKLEADFEHMPDRNQVHNIELALANLNGEFKALNERLQPVAAIASRLQELEFERAAGK